MTTILQGNDTISRFVESQFPAFYHESGPELVAFLRAYYEFLETHDRYATYVTRRMFEYGDIDLTLQEFVTHFKNKYLKDFPIIGATDQRFLIKHIMDVYRAKGTPQALRLLFQILFGTDVDIHLPAIDMWKLSDSKWTQPFYLEMSVSTRNLRMVNKQITGATSGATAFVESVVRKRVEGKIIDVVYISHIKGNFKTGELVSEDGVLNNAPEVIGSLSSIDVTLGGANFKVGDILEVYSTHGRQGRVRVSAIENATGRVNFELLDGGYGYTLTRLGSGALYDYRSDIYVSTAMLYIDNPTLKFQQYERVEQKRQLVDLVSGLQISSYDWQPGDVLNGYAIIGGVSTKTAEAVVGNIVNYDASGDPVTTPQANCQVEVFPLSGRFDQLTSVDIDSAFSSAEEGDHVEEESYYTLIVSAVAGSFAVGNRIIQPVYQTVSGEQVVTSVATGIISSISGSTYDISPAFGTFLPGRQLINIVTNATAMVDNAVETVPGAVGRIDQILSPTKLILSEPVGSFSIGKAVALSKDPYNSRNVTDVDDAGVVDVRVAANESLQGVVASVTDQSVDGIIVGQNTIAVGVYGNTAPFSSISSEPIQLMVDAGDMEEATWLKTNVSVASTLEGDNTITSTASNANRHVSQVVVLQQDEPYKLSFRVTNPGLIASSLVVAITQPSSVNDVVLFNLVDDTYSVLTAGTIDTILVNRVAGSMWLDVTIYMLPTTTGSANFRFAIDYQGITNAPAASSLIVSRVLLNSEQNLRRSWIITLDRPNGEPQEIGYINRIGTGQGATFEIGALENEESITVNTDIVGGTNVTGNVTYPEIGVGGWNSGIGHISGFAIVSGGSGYSNGASVYTAPSGISVPARGTITTDGSGAITSIALDDSGYGFNQSPTVILPATSGTSAVVNATSAFGYGFPANPPAGLNNLIGDALTIDSMSIGTISALSRINPGANYNAPPFVAVRNKWIAGFERKDFVVTLSSFSGVFREGELVVQTVPDPNSPGNTTIARGIVKTHVADKLYVKRASFSVGLSAGASIAGFDSGASGTVASVDQDVESLSMGDNAIIGSKVQTANGTVTAVEVIDSGYGYEENETVGLKSNNNITVVEGISHLGKQGRGTGFWETTTSHISHDKVLQDSYFYQDFSYQVRSEFSMNRYEDLLEKVTHVAGHKLFGAVVINREVDMSVEMAESQVEQEDTPLSSLFDEGQPGFWLGPFD